MEERQKLEKSNSQKLAEVELPRISEASKVGNGRKQELNPNSETKTENLLEKMLEKENLVKAMENVMKNKGAAGVDGMGTKDLKDYLIFTRVEIKEAILNDTYKPKPVRRVEIPKEDGSKRLIGIPTVTDRFIQQAILQVLTPHYETLFYSQSYGFRPGKSAHQAVLKAQEYVNEGYEWVVDIDLEKFFDQVQHDKLMSIMSRTVKDKRLLKLIRKYLNSGVMVAGIFEKTEKGTPQGGPLSPLLANVMLNELDKELNERGHRYCRYADDCNIYVKTPRAGERVLNSVRNFIEKKLKLKVNENKTKVDRVRNRKFLGFTMYRDRNGKYEITLARKSKEKVKKKLKELTRTGKSKKLEEKIKAINILMIGWMNYFKIGKLKSYLEELMGWTRRRLRSGIRKQRKKVKTKYANLKKLGMKPEPARTYANTRKGPRRTSESRTLTTTLTNRYFQELGLIDIVSRFVATVK